MENEMSLVEKTKVAKGFASWISIDLTIKIFGVTILEWHYPPLSDR